MNMPTVAEIETFGLAGFSLTYGVMTFRKIGAFGRSFRKLEIREEPSDQFREQQLFGLYLNLERGVILKAVAKASVLF
jgi:hypothetical protein